MTTTPLDLIAARAERATEGGIVNSKIIREGKAQWTYSCMLCQDTHTAMDQFRAIEYQQRHERTNAHQTALIGKAVDAFGEALSEMGRYFAKAFEPLGQLRDAITGKPKPPPWAGNIAKQRRPRRA